MPDLRDIVDSVIELPVVSSFTKIGYAVRSRLDDWKDLDGYDLHGRTYVVTGSTSGLGRFTAEKPSFPSRPVPRLRAAGLDPDVYSTVDISIAPRDGDEMHSGRSILRGTLAEA